LGREFLGGIAYRLKTERAELFCDVRQRAELDNLAMKRWLMGPLITDLRASSGPSNIPI